MGFAILFGAIATVALFCAGNISADIENNNSDADIVTVILLVIAVIAGGVAVHDIHNLGERAGYGTLASANELEPGVYGVEFCSENVCRISNDEDDWYIYGNYTTENVVVVQYETGRHILPLADPNGE